MGSAASINLNNISISSVKILFNGVDLGAVEGDVTVTVETMKSEIKVAQLGGTVVDMVDNGQNITLKAKLLEVSPATLKRVFSTAKLNSGNTNLLFDNNIGAKSSSAAGVLVLHPLSKDDNDKSADWTFFKAVGKPSTALAYGSDTMTGAEVEFFALPDFTTAPARFAVFGDPAIGLQGATAAPAVAGGSNAGNGTVDSILASSSSQSETVSLVALTPTKFSVAGGDGRALGVATVGTPFTADDASAKFTINAGSTPFVAGDAFTIAYTAANYS